jgi:hypothetical protein
MHRSASLVIGALAASLILATTTASARNLSLSNSNFRATYSPIELETGGGTPISCLVTMEGSFHSTTIVKSIGALIGYITRSSLARPCTGFGEAWIYNGTEGGLTGNVNSLPWHVTYEGFTGTLPAIGRLKLLAHGLRIAVQAVFGVCLSIYGPNKNYNKSINVKAGGTFGEVSPDETQVIEQESGNCGAVSFRARGSVTVLGSSTPITVTLI